MKKFLSWVVSTIIKDVLAAFLPIITSIGLLIVVAVNAPSYFKLVFFPIVILVVYFYAKIIK
ncbi:hypothetical protein [Escherichia sp. E13S3]|uniref:hypothetical protein n=1 Tax=Escherichia sp. E13S3 TaxID=2484854 RepID=UPI001029AD46|nr:hypothetical protein [Escherichia sp. E13S3]RZN46494.1 hypothetical protein D9597_17495 [Escherichia sp. E13S3]